MEQQTVHASRYMIQSQEEELKRVSDELHDGICQRLYSIHIGLHAIESALEGSDLKQYVLQMSGELSSAILQLRHLSEELYPPTLTTLGLTPAMKNYAQLFTSTFGVVVEISSNGPEKILSEQKSLNVFRVCQEALINIAKYAEVATASLQFTWEEETLKIVIEDAGKGFDAKDVQFLGIAAMKKRMRLAEGDFQLSSQLGKGTKIMLSLSI
ncbi:sensor histidine kinase [Salicibibacter cibarius]|uniref:histidine kinase n=1 Tax=Salicibibacter cibarius TaxID=2743000 RepID=A0A7T6Z0J2_9BACI|nr:histidine kinase [Salicibibacter cibarius]QQK74760.1 sensor histidine kinase [Salicibibacter cibarius]